MKLKHKSLEKSTLGGKGSGGKVVGWEGNPTWTSWCEEACTTERHAARCMHIVLREMATTVPPLLSSISNAVRETLISNLFSVPTDCPQRSERWGWMADASVSAERHCAGEYNRGTDLCDCYEARQPPIKITCVFGLHTPL